MDNNVWYDVLIDKIYKKFQKKAQMTQALVDLLGLEREAVYRRLRKDVFFSADEIMKIASTWNISLDEITNINSEQFSFQMRQVNYINPSKEEQVFLQGVISSINSLQNVPDSEFLYTCNKLPRLLLSGFEHLNHFYLFKWKYLYGGENETIAFSDVIISEEKKKISADYFKAIKNVPNTNIIFDRKIFEYLISDIQYFSSIYLIKDTEKELIKNDLYNLLDYLLEVANKGYYPETHNKVNIYISQLNVETNYCYTFSPETSLCFVIVFEKNEIYSVNTEMVSNFIAWMQLQKKTSTQISEVDERSRVEFFTKQRQIIDSL
jgi:hypothetical protein